MKDAKEEVTDGDNDRLEQQRRKLKELEENLDKFLSLQLLKRLVQACALLALGEAFGNRLKETEDEYRQEIARLEKQKEKKADA